MSGALAAGGSKAEYSPSGVIPKKPFVPLKKGSGKMAYNSHKQQLQNNQRRRKAKKKRGWHTLGPEIGHFIIAKLNHKSMMIFANFIIIMTSQLIVVIGRGKELLLLSSIFFYRNETLE